MLLPGLVTTIPKEVVGKSDCEKNLWHYVWQTETKILLYFQSDHIGPVLLEIQDLQSVIVFSVRFS